MPLRKRPDDELIRLVVRGEALMGEGLLDEAARTFERCLALAPAHSGAWHDLGLIRKWQKRWAESLRCNRRATELDPEDEGAWWNMGIAATAVRDWAAARAAWRGVGIDLPDGDGPIVASFGLTPVRLNPDDQGEVVWGDRIDPARVIVRSIPLPESGHRWGDYVLHDGEPKGQRAAFGRAYSVFDELERWEPSDVPTLRAEVTAATADDAAELVELFDRAELAAEDWTESIRPICRECSEGSDPVEHEHAAPTTWQPQRDFGLAAPPATAEELLARWAAAGVGRRYGRVEIVA